MIHWDVKPEGHKWIPFAKNRLIQMKNLADLVGVPIYNQVIRPDSSTRIHLNTCFGLDRVRIETGGGPVFASVWFDFADTSRYLLLVTSAEGKQIYRVLLPVGAIPFALRISADGRSQYVLCADTLSEVSTPVTYTLVVVENGAITKSPTVVVTPDVGWVIQPRNLFTDLPSIYAQVNADTISISNGRCLAVAGKMHDNSRVYGNLTFYGLFPRLVRNAKVVVVYFDGESLSAQYSQWIPQAGVYSGSVPVGTSYTSLESTFATCAPDCTQWSFVVDAFYREDLSTLYAETNIADPFTSSSFRDGVAFDKTEFSANRLSGGVDSGFCTRDGAVVSQFHDTVFSSGSNFTKRMRVYRDTSIVTAHEETSTGSSLSFITVPSISSSDGDLLTPIVPSEVRFWDRSAATFSTFSSIGTFALASELIPSGDMLYGQTSSSDLAYLKQSSSGVTLSLSASRVLRMNEGTLNAIEKGRFFQVGASWYVRMWEPNFSEDGTLTAYASTNLIAIDASKVTLTGLSGPTITYSRPGADVQLVDSIYTSGAAF